MQISFCDVTKLPPRTTALKTPNFDSFQGELYDFSFKLLHILMILKCFSPVKGSSRKKSCLQSQDPKSVFGLTELGSVENISTALEKFLGGLSYFSYSICFDSWAGVEIGVDLKDGESLRENFRCRITYVQDIPGQFLRRKVLFSSVLKETKHLVDTGG